MSSDESSYHDDTSPEEEYVGRRRANVDSVESSTKTSDHPPLATAPHAINDVTEINPESPYVAPENKIASDTPRISDPENGKSEGSRFDLDEGKRKAMIESAYSTEIDGGIISNPVVKKNTKFTFAIIAALTIIAASIAGVLVVNGVFSQSNKSTAPAFVEVLPKTFTKTVPASILTSVKLTNNSFVSTINDSLNVKTLKPVATSEECELSKASEFCLVGNIEIKEFNSRLFYTGDLVHLSVFTNMFEYTELKNDKLTLTASTVIDFAGSPTKFLLFTNSVTGSGYFLEIPLESTATDIDDIANSLTYIKG